MTWHLVLRPPHTGLCFSSGNKMALHPATRASSRGCQLWVMGLANLHLLAGPDKSIKLYMSCVSTGHFPKVLCPSDQLPQHLPLRPTYGTSQCSCFLPSTYFIFLSCYVPFVKTFFWVLMSTTMCIKGLPWFQLAPSFLALEHSF